MKALAPRPSTLLLRLPRPRSEAETLAHRSLLFLVHQWSGDFAESAHVLPFPSEQGFRGPKWMHVGDIFARTVIADALADADERFTGQLETIVDTEIAVLAARARRTGVGGWSYFPELVELPPDADDLAQMLRLLARRGRGDLIRSLCERPLAVLLGDCARGDGSFETWIVPARERSEEEELQARWVTHVWGEGADAEVVANLLHALEAVGRERFAAVIDRGARWLTTVQEPDGSWISTWYHGPYYGLWTALRLLGSRGDAADAVARAIGFLAASQREDGGWGFRGDSDPLSTALALLALHSAGALEPPRLAQATAFLARTCAIDGGWDAVPWIRMQLGRPSGRVRQVLSYSSRNITTAFVLKAALATGPSEKE